MEPITPKTRQYNTLCAQLESLLAGERDTVANLANAAAVLYHGLPELNWAGFYLVKEGELVLGPFQGRVACVRIPFDRGVCGAAVREDRVQRVADVHAFPGHIACDCASSSEIVLPLHDGEQVAAVLDMDSPHLNRFDGEDQAGLERCARIIERACDWLRP
ncbi:MAG: GAF domain-containing protein [Clostridiales bacterium]|nr:GAF domain-containing protein [Clostridiales bacterium]